MEEQILKILEDNPLLSNREIGKIIGKSRTAVQYYMNKLNIHRDRKLMQRNNNTCREKKLYLTENAEQILLGSVLGDGYIDKHRKPKNTKQLLNSCLIISQGIKQEAYVKYKKELLEKENIKCHLSFLSADKYKPHYIKDILIKENGRYTLKTQRNVIFNYYRDIFYFTSTTKRVNKYLYKLKALGLAIWYMDDGYKTNRYYRLCTNSFTFKEVFILQKILKHNFNIESTVINSNLKQPVLNIRAKSSETFKSLILPYVCDSMTYKL